MIVDMHTHTKNSIDGKSTMDEYCAHILSNPDFTPPCVICFTDHVDYNPSDIGYTYYNPDTFFDEFYTIKDKYAQEESEGKIKLLCGIEFGEPHCYPQMLEKYAKLPYDIILGSVHFFWGDKFISQMVKENYPVKEAFQRYFDEVYKAVSTGGFDVLAHMDFPKRYFKAEYHEPDVIKSIFSQMQKNNILLEINMSSFRHGLTEPLPGDAILSIYKETGGKRVTVGSDAHSADRYGVLCESVPMDFEWVYFEKRQPVSVSSLIV